VRLCESVRQCARVLKFFFCGTRAGGMGFVRSFHYTGNTREVS
jgi:hypothetical protein